VVLRTLGGGRGGARVDCRAERTSDDGSGYGVGLLAWEICRSLLKKQAEGRAD